MVYPTISLTVAADVDWSLIVDLIAELLCDPLCSRPRDRHSHYPPTIKPRFAYSCHPCSFDITRSTFSLKGVEIYFPERMLWGLETATLTIANWEGRHIPWNPFMIVFESSVFKWM